MKYANIVVVIVCLVFCTRTCFAQQNEEKQLEKCYRALVAAHKCPDVSPVNDEPFYKLDEKESSRGALAGQYCYATYSSNQLHEMETIFRLYKADNGSTVYALLNDSTQKRLLDITHVRCGSPHFKMDTSINEVYRSYLQWWDTVKRFPTKNTDRSICLIQRLSFHIRNLSSTYLHCWMMTIRYAGLWNNIGCANDTPTIQTGRLSPN